MVVRITYGCSAAETESVEVEVCLLEQPTKEVRYRTYRAGQLYSIEAQKTVSEEKVPRDFRSFLSSSFGIRSEKIE
jgi:hypothetical protein